MASDDDDKGDKTYKESVASYVNSTIRQDVVKKLLEDSFQNSEITNDALNLVVEVARCIVIETCIRAADRTLSGNRIKVNNEDVQECLPQLMLDFP